MGQSATLHVRAAYMYYINIALIEGGYPIEFVEETTNQTAIGGNIEMIGVVADKGITTIYLQEFELGTFNFLFLLSFSHLRSAASANE